MVRLNEAEVMCQALAGHITNAKLRVKLENEAKEETHA